MATSVLSQERLSDKIRLTYWLLSVGHLCRCRDNLFSKDAGIEASFLSWASLICLSLSGLAPLRIVEGYQT
jgi:hypothetical protein